MSEEYKIDDKDLKILKFLDKSLEEKRVIQKFTVDMNTHKIDYEIMAIILLKIVGEYINEKKLNC